MKKAAIITILFIMETKILAKSGLRVSLLWAMTLLKAPGIPICAKVIIMTMVGEASV